MSFSRKIIENNKIDPKPQIYCPHNRHIGYRLLLPKKNIHRCLDRNCECHGLGWVGFCEVCFSQVHRCLWSGCIDGIIIYSISKCTEEQNILLNQNKELSHHGSIKHHSRRNRLIDYI